jgi:hypothetical protein
MVNPSIQEPSQHPRMASLFAVNTDGLKQIEVISTGSLRLCPSFAVCPMATKQFIQELFFV